MPMHLLNHFIDYENEYAKIKRGRKLAWMDHLGTVEVEIALEDREILIEASPLQTAILVSFEDNGMGTTGVSGSRDRLSIDDLCQMTGINAMSVKRAVLFWVLHGVLKEIAPDTFQVLEHAEETSPSQSISLINSI